MVETRLPLREELMLFDSAILADGQPSWILHDPARNLFFQIDWLSFEILKRWHLPDANAIVQDICEQTTLQARIEDVAAVHYFLQSNQLLQTASNAAPTLSAILQKQRGSKWQWLLHHYLFFRVPLFNPNRWLTRLLPHLNFVYSSAFLKLTALMAVLGLVGIYRDWQRFSSTLVDMLSWHGLLAYGITLVTVKVLHEVGHGLTAKRYGCKVPTMGVALLVLWPVAYTDTNEAWKLSNRKQRFNIAAAGIVTELMIAAWATVGWLILPDGAFRIAAFLLATTTWVSTIIINASPFMRFDGYFLLSDYLQIPNLHARSFALARWRLREQLFDLGDAPPEQFSPKMQSALIIFAWIVWVYRLVVFLGIALLVYHFFIKIVGILLFLVEIIWFVLLPLTTEMKVWRERWIEIKQRWRAWRSAILSLCIMALLFIPWPTRIHATGIAQPQNQLMLYSPAHAQLVAMPYQHRQAVKADTTLLLFNSPDMERRVQQALIKQENLAWQSAAAGFDTKMKQDWQVLNEKLASAYAEQRTVDADGQLYQPQARFNGKIEYDDPDLRPGQWMQEREFIGRVVSNDPWHVITYVEERDIHRLAVGSRGLFLANGAAGPNLNLIVDSIDKDASPTLNEKQLASLFGGHVAVREKNGILYPEQAIYRVVLKIEDNHLSQAIKQHEWRGNVTLCADWESPTTRFFNAALSIFWREAGF